MTETLSIRIDKKTKKQFDDLARHAKRSKSSMAREAIVAYVEAEGWQLGEIEAGLKDLDEGRVVSHENVSKWLRSWGEASKAQSL